MSADCSGENSLKVAKFNEINESDSYEIRVGVYYCLYYFLSFAIKDGSSEQPHMEQSNTIEELQQQLELAKDVSTRISLLYDKLNKEMHQKQNTLPEEHQDVVLHQIRKISSASNQAGKKIKLNVGGSVFMTTIDTLTTEKNTFFSAMFSEQFNTKPDEDGEVFIDRDPKYFGLILNHLRGVDLQALLDQMPKEKLNVFTQEVTYYQITSLLSVIEQVPKESPNQTYFFADNSKDGVMQQHDQVNKGTLLSQGKHTWRVLIVKLVGSRDASIEVGVVSAAPLESNSSSSSEKAWTLARNRVVCNDPYRICGVGFAERDILTFHLDLGAGYLIVEVNGKHAWTHLDVVAPVCLTFSGEAGSAVRILD